MTLELFLKKLKNYALPIAIVTGILLHTPLTEYRVTEATPYMIVLMLFFSFLKISIREIRFSWSLVLVMLLQIVLAIGSYYLVSRSPISHASVWAEGIMICFLCPTASASPVVVGILGGRIAVATSFVLLDTIGIALVTPLILGAVSDSSLPFWATCWTIVQKIMPIVLVPLLLSEGVRHLSPSCYQRLLRIPLAAFWAWVITLTLIMAKTFHFVWQEPQTMWLSMGYMCLAGGLTCVVQFALGKAMGKHFWGESITMGQALGQKNSTIGIWIVHSFLNPVASVAMAAYSIWQNLFNSWQLIRKERDNRKQT